MTIESRLSDPIEIDLTDYEIPDTVTAPPKKTGAKRVRKAKPRTPAGPPLPPEDSNGDGGGRRGPWRAGAIEYGEQLALRIAGRYRFAPGLGWRRFNGAHWEEATDEQLIPEIREMIAAYAPTVLRRDGSDGAKAIANASSGSGIAGILRVAKGWEGVFTKNDEFDRPRPPGCPDDPHLFPCANGVTVELYDNGEWRVRDSRPDDLMTRAGCAYVADATADFTGEMFAKYQPDPEIRSFILRIMVGALRGVQLQHLFVWYGALAGNGKGTMQAVFMEVFGAYSRTIPVQALMRSHSSNEYRDEIARLKGVRLVFADEPEEGSRFAAGFVSRITGGSEISARGMYARSMSFVPTWALMMPTNKRPAWGDHSGLTRRYNEVSWDYVIPREQMSESVKDRMRAEASGVLNQLLRHWSSFCSGGLAIPDAVAEQTALGRAESDPVERFLADCVMPATNGRVKGSQMYKAYTEWCETQNERPRSGNALAEALRNKGYTHKRNNGAWWVGVVLTDSDFV